MSRLRKLFVVISMVVFVGPFILTASAQEGETSDGTLTFPVAELGNCEDLGSCMLYCEGPVNHASSVEYAKKKGFYVDDPVISASDEFWSGTQEALGCESKESCFEFCDNPDNYGICHEFASSEGIPGGIVAEPGAPAVLDAAFDTLGCVPVNNWRNSYEGISN